MRLPYEVHDTDVVALRRLYQSLPEGRRQIRREYLTALGAGLVAVGFLFFVPAGPCLQLPPMALPIALLAASVIASLTYWYMLKRADTAFVAAHHDVATGTHEMTLTEEGIHEERPYGAVFHRWTVVEDVVDGPEHVFIRLGRHGTYIIPKRGSPAEASAFARSASELWSASRKGRLTTG